MPQRGGRAHGHRTAAEARQSGAGNGAKRRRTRGRCATRVRRSSPATCSTLMRCTERLRAAKPCNSACRFRTTIWPRQLMRRRWLESVHQYVADDALADEHHRNYRVARRAGAQLVRAACCARAAHGDAGRLLPDSDPGISARVLQKYSSRFHVTQVS